MDILAWLRKLGHERGGRVFRSLDIDRLLGAADLRKPNLAFLSRREALLSAIALPKERAITPERRTAARWDHVPGPGLVLDNRPPPTPSMLAGRFAVAPGQHRQTPLVGRETELRWLLDAWGRAASGHGQIVLLSGDAGIGKSRLLRECRMDEPHTTLWHRCSPERAFSPFHPVVGLLQEGAGQNVEPRRRAGASCAQSKSTPQRRRQRTFELLLARFERLARKQMVFAVYEDLQWADPSTLEFLGRMVDRIAKRPVLAVMTFRPKFAIPWQGHADAVSLALAPLECGPCQAMIQQVSPGETLAEPIVEDIVARSGGVPLFVEELTKAALEVADRVELDGRADAATADEVPLALREGLIARLAAAPEAMAIAQIGAVIGCEFSRDLVGALVDWPQDQLQSALDQLVASEVVSLACGPAGETAYVFRHDLVREAVYQSIAEPVRRELHGSIAGILEARWPDVAANTPELLAPHYAAAGLAEPAVACWLRAGMRANDQCAHEEAIAMFGKGLDLIDRLPAGSAAVQSAQLLAVLAQALTVTKGLTAPEVAQASAMARQLCQSSEDDARLFPLTRSLWEHYNTRGDFEAACELAEQCQRLAVAGQEPESRGRGRFLRRRELAVRGAAGRGARSPQPQRGAL